MDTLTTSSSIVAPQADLAVAPTTDAEDRSLLISLLKEFALVKGDVVLSSGAKAKYFIDAKRVVMRRDGFDVIGRLVSRRASELAATAVGGLTLGADPIAYATMAAGAPVDVFVVRKEAKPHGLKKQIEGRPLTKADRCLIVDDVVTSGSSTIRAIEAVKQAGLEICGVVAILDRLAGGAGAIEEAADAGFKPLATIEDVYPERPDRTSSR